MKNTHSQETLVPRRGDVGHVGEVSGVVVAGAEVELGEDLRGVPAVRVLDAQVAARISSITGGRFGFVDFDLAVSNLQGPNYLWCQRFSVCFVLKIPP